MRDCICRRERERTSSITASRCIPAAVSFGESFKFNEWHTLKRKIKRPLVGLICHEIKFIKARSQKSITEVVESIVDQ